MDATYTCSNVTGPLHYTCIFNLSIIESIYSLIKFKLILHKWYCFPLLIVARVGMLQMLPKMAQSSLEPESSEQAFYSKLTAKGARSRYEVLW